MLAPPVGAYRETGAQYTGGWGAFVGTAIAPHYFITAVHVGGGVGDPFTFNGTKHTAEGVTTISGTDLAVWRVRERLPRWASLYDRRGETGKEMILYGRGCRRGRSLIFEGVMRGWQWGAADGSLSWGRNRVDSVAALPNVGEMLVFDFDRLNGDEEGTVGSGDSGGGVFVQDGTLWKLAGVNHASGGRFSQNPTGAEPFMAALYDTRGLYQATGDGWKQLDPGATDPSPTLAFATRVSHYTAEIRTIIGARNPDNDRTPLSTRAYLLIAAGILLVIFFTLGIRSRALHARKK